MDWGWGKRRIAIFYWVMSAILGLIALQLNSAQKLYTMILITVALGGLLLWLNLATNFLRPPGPGKP